MQPNRFATDPSAAIEIHVLEADALEGWLATQKEADRNWVNAAGFDAGLGKFLILPGENGNVRKILVGWGSPKARLRDRWHFGILAAELPAGTYKIASGLEGPELRDAALAWLLAGYRFDRYKTEPYRETMLCAPEGVDAARLETIADGFTLGRDLINTPTSDMGPDQLEQAFLDVANRFSAQTEVIQGKELLTRNFPMIHAVGRASDQEPRLLDMVWGDKDAPKVTLVGKGVCFDTGGLNIKPGASMGLMKKDMGGAANVLALAHMVMALKLPVRLRVLIPAVENSISAGAFRPQDVLTSRKGLTVEVNNTDAEGRLVLADALALADEEAPDLMFCMATLTGAARVALGPDLPPYFTNNDVLASEIAAASAKSNDPLWRLPLWPSYEAMIEPDIADLDNAPAGGMAGAITAALFLHRFVESTSDFAHFDIYGWTPAAKPARPKGGAVQGPLALLAVIEKRFGG